MAVKLIRARNAISFDHLKDLLAVEGFGVEQAAEELKQTFAQLPDTSFCLIAVEDDTILAFVIGFAHPQTSVVNLIQAYEKEVGSLILDKLFLRFMLWCEQNEFSEIRAGNGNVDEKILTRFGFGVYRKIMNLEVTTSLENKILDKTALVIDKEVKNDTQK